MTYAVAITNASTSPPVVGWALAGCRVATYPTQDDADKAARKLRADKRYSWNNFRVEAAEYKEGRK